LVYVLKEKKGPPKESGRYFNFEFLPNHVYCFLPTNEEDEGKVTMYTEEPPFLVDFPFYFFIGKVKKDYSVTGINITILRYATVTTKTQVMTDMSLQMMR
jgi:hypothetical protein